MADIQVSRQSIYDGSVIGALMRVAALQSDNVDEADDILELILDMKFYCDRITQKMKLQSEKYGGVWNTFHPPFYSFADPNNETAFTTYLGTYLTDTTRVTRMENNKPNPAVKSWEEIAVTVLESPAPADETTLTGIVSITVN